MAQEFLSRKLVAFMREMDLLTLRATFFKGTVLPSMLSAGHPAFSFSSLAWGYRGLELAEVLPSARRLPQPEPAGRSSIHKDPSLPLTPACWFALEVETRQEEGSAYGMPGRATARLPGGRGVSLFPKGRTLLFLRVNVQEKQYTSLSHCSYEIGLGSGYFFFLPFFFLPQ